MDLAKVHTFGHEKARWGLSAPWGPFQILRFSDMEEGILAEGAKPSLVLAPEKYEITKE